MTEYCVCGHPKEQHFENLIDVRCKWCWFAKESAWHSFKLDNLKLIEDIAQERKLV